MHLPPEAAARVTTRRAERRLSFRRAARVSGLSVGTWQRAEAGEGLTYPTLVAMFGALGWPVEGIDILLAGGDPEAVDGRTSVEAAIAADPELTDQIKGIMVAFYRSALDQSRKAE